MKREIDTGKWVAAAVLVLWWLLGDTVGYGEGDMNVWRHLVFPLSHANVFHLAGNLFAMFCILKGKMRMGVAVAISFLCSFVPVWGLWEIGVTVGFSGVLFADLGIRWGEYCCRNTAAYKTKRKEAAYWTFCKRALPFAVAGVLVPHLNWGLHTYCLLAGFVYGFLQKVKN